MIIQAKKVMMTLDTDLPTWLSECANQQGHILKQEIMLPLRADQQGQGAVEKLEPATMPNTAKTPVITDEDLLDWQKECNIACL